MRKATIFFNGILPGNNNKIAYCYSKQLNDTENNYHTMEIYKKVLKVALLACLLIMISIIIISKHANKTTLPMIHCILAVIVNNDVITNNDLKEHNDWLFLEFHILLLCHKALVLRRI